MSSILVLRERLKQIYASYSIYIQKAAQFLLGLFVFWQINSNVGFMKNAASIFCTLGLAVICTFFPVIIMVLAATALILVHFYTLSLPIAIVSAVIFLLMYLFYFRFTPEKAWLILVSALACVLKIPFIIPVLFGLLGTPVWVVPASCGVISYYMLHFVKGSATALKETDGLTNGLMNFAKQVIAGKEMWLMVLAVAIGVLVVNLIRSRAVDHAWKIASFAGGAVCIIIATAGNMVLGLHISYGTIILSSVIGILLGLVLELVFFSVDYSRTERVQFEDDEYYYYVKAVPKVVVATPEKTVKHITEHTQEKEDKDVGEQEEQETEWEEVKRRTDDLLLTQSLHFCLLRACVPLHRAGSLHGRSRLGLHHHADGGIRVQIIQIGLDQAGGFPLLHQGSGGRFHVSGNGFLFRCPGICRQGRCERLNTQAAHQRQRQQHRQEPAPTSFCCHFSCFLSCVDFYPPLHNG